MAGLELTAYMASFNDFYQLTKPRLSFLSLFSALIGFAIAPKLAVPSWGLLYTGLVSLGIACSAGGAAVLNQWMEHRLDGLMLRTKDRPIPAGRVRPQTALYFGLLLSGIGLGLLYAVSSPLTGSLALLTLVSYLLLYTPIKRLSPINTLIGAFPGALPPLIGWSAAEGTLSLMAGLLFALLFFWQMPHFYALAWLYREDYASAGFKMLTLSDPKGVTVGQRSFLYSLILVAITVLPYYYGFTSLVYLLIVSVLNLYLIRKAYAFMTVTESAEKRAQARNLFIASILYLPALLLLLCLDTAVFNF